jgi:type II secretory pathway pseudopilin PulG
MKKIGRLKGNVMLRKRQNGRLAAGGFSLIELIVVVGIIVLLMAILLPALAAAKKQSYITSTGAELGAIRSGCEQYYTSFGSYPGVFPEAAIASSSSALSGTQNLVISLMGGLSTSSGTQIPPGTITSATPAYNNTSVFVLTPGAGPTDLPAPSASKQYLPFYTARGDVVPASGITTAPAADLAFPTIVDHFPDALPILYYRRTTGVSAPAVSETAGSPASCFYRKCNAMYTDTTTLKSTSGLVFNQKTGPSVAPLSISGTDPTGTLAALSCGVSSAWNSSQSFAVGNKTGSSGWIYQAIAANTNSQPTQSGGASTNGNWQTSSAASGAVPGGAFVLISAGPSRLYGNSDSIVALGGE